MSQILGGSGSGGGGGGASFNRKVVSTTTYNQVVGDNGYCLDVQTSAATAINLTATTPLFYGFIQNNGTGVVTVTPATGLINNQSTFTLQPGEGSTFATDNSNYTALTWVSGGASLPGASTATVTTASLAAGAYQTGTLTMAKSFFSFKVVVSSAARVRLYSTAAARTADLSRSNQTPPVPGTQHGVICDLYLDTSDKWTWICSPQFPGSNGDSTQSTTIYYAITNIGTVSTAITATVTYVPTES